MLTLVSLASPRTIETNLPNLPEATVDVLTKNVVLTSPWAAVFYGHLDDTIGTVKRHLTFIVLCVKSKCGLGKVTGASTEKMVNCKWVKFQF